MVGFTVPAGRGGNSPVCQEEGKPKEISNHEDATRQLGRRHSWAGVLLKPCSYATRRHTDVSKKGQVHSSVSARRTRRWRAHTHSLCHASTYYVLPFKKNTLVSLGPSGGAGLGGA